MSSAAAVPPADPAALARSVSEALTASLPGSDPAEIRAAARRLRATGGVLRSTLSRVRTLSESQTCWTGTAASAFARQVGSAPRHVGTVAERYETYARVLSDYARSVDVVRADIRARRRDLEQAWRAYTVAEARLASIGLAGVRSASTVSSATALAPHFTRALPIAERPRHSSAARSCLAHADDVVRQHGRVRACYLGWEAIARASGTRLHDVDNRDRLHNPHGWQALVESTSDWAAKISTNGSIIGLVALVLVPEFAPLVFAAVAAAGAAKAAADVDRKLQYGEGVSGWDFADDALGILPATAFARATVAGARAVRTAESMPGVGRTVGSVLRSEIQAPYRGALPTLRFVRSAHPLTGRAGEVRAQAENVVLSVLQVAGVGSEQVAGAVRSRLGDEHSSASKARTPLVPGGGNPTLGSPDGDRDAPVSPNIVDRNYGAAGAQVAGPAAPPSTPSPDENLPQPGRRSSDRPDPPRT
jgi:uncharacterized protein YukE